MSDLLSRPSSGTQQDQHPMLMIQTQSSGITQGQAQHYLEPRIRVLAAQDFLRLWAGFKSRL